MSTVKITISGGRATGKTFMLKALTKLLSEHGATVEYDMSNIETRSAVKYASGNVNTSADIAKLIEKLDLKVVIKEIAE
jgi:uridine kinase